MIVLLVSILILLGLVWVYYSIQDKQKKKLFKYIIMVFSLSIVLEFTLFNIRHYESLFYDEIKITDYNLGAGLEEDEDGNIRVAENDRNYIDIIGINAHLNNIYLNFDTKDVTSKVINLSLGYTDEANRYFAYAQEKKISTSLKDDGDILKLHLAGKTKRIRMYVRTLEEYSTFKIKDISFNKTVPLRVSFVRPAFILIVFLLIYAFRPNSVIYKINLFNKKSKKFLVATVLIEIIFLVIVSQFNYYFVKEKFRTDQRMQYQLLAEAFMKGQTYLDIDPHPILKGLPNPYDKKARNTAFENLIKAGNDLTLKPDDFYIWDAAFFNNHYYVYFGVAPVITYFLPFYAITGHHLKTVTCINITMIICVIGIFLLLKEICRKWFKNVNLGAFIAIFLLFINASGILSIMGRPDHYSLPIIMAIMFSIYGLYWWLKAVDNDLNAKYLFLGSLCMASVAACRPQILLTSFFAIPIFFDKIFKERKLFSKDSIKETIAFVFPYVLIAIPLMIYNHVRFGSFTDFGANYNLTTNDMTKRGFVFDRIPLGIFYYLFNPININLIFPFINRVGVATNYMGTTIFEDMGAGFILVNFLSIFALILPKYKNEFKDKLPYKLALLSVIFTFIIIIADTQMAGILPRYICDFGFLMYIAIAFVVFNKLEKKKNTDILNKIIYISFVVGMIYNFVLLFSDSVIVNSGLFSYLRRLFQFWM